MLLSPLVTTGVSRVLYAGHFMMCLSCTLLLNLQNYPDNLLLHCKDLLMKRLNPITALIIILFGLLLWQMHLQHWGSFLLLVAAEAALIAVRSTETAKSKRL